MPRNALLPRESVTEAVAHAVLAKAEGNPLFLEELARVVSEGSGGAAAGLGAPETIEELLLARIDRLPAAARRLLETAAVLGREMPCRLLAALWDEPGDLDVALEQLIGQGLLYERFGGDENAYVFGHSLVHTVAYARIFQGRRRALHGAAGTVLEHMYQGRAHEIADLLAHHFGASDHADRAVDYALVAAEQAHRRWANTEALAHFDRARTRLVAMPDSAANRLRRIDVVVKQTEVMFALGRHAEHIEALEAIRDLVEASADPPRRAAWHYWTGFLHSLTGSHPDVAIAYCREASSIAESSGLTEIRGFAACCLAHSYEVAGRFRDAIAAGEEALGIFELHRNTWWACRALWVLGIAALYTGDWERSLEHCGRALAHAERVDDRRLRIVSLLRIGSVHAQRGDPGTALRYCEKVLALSPDPFDAAMVRSVHGYALVKLGKLREAEEELEEVLAWFDRSRLRFTRSLAALRVAECYLVEGEQARAGTILEDVLGTSRELGYRHCEAVAERLRGESLLGVDLESAAEHLDRAMAMLAEIGARDDLAKSLVARAELARTSGDRDRARKLLMEARALFEALGTVDGPSRVDAVLRNLDS